MANQNLIGTPIAEKISSCKTTRISKEPKPRYKTENIHFGHRVILWYDILFLSQEMYFG